MSNERFRWATEQAQQVLDEFQVVLVIAYDGEGAWLITKGESEQVAALLASGVVENIEDFPEIFQEAIKIIKESAEQKVRGN